MVNYGYTKRADQKLYKTTQKHPSMASTWRMKVPSSLKDHLEMQIAEASKHAAYKEAKNPSLAQLWLAVANLSKQLFEANLKLRYLERAFKDYTGNAKDGSGAEEAFRKVISAKPVKPAEKPAAPVKDTKQPKAPVKNSKK